MVETISLRIKIWRQEDASNKGFFKKYTLNDLSTELSFLEMLDLLNRDLELKGEEPVAFDHDCREGICGACGAVVNGKSHGPMEKTTLCQLHLRHFKDNQVLVIEPFRARAFPVVKDLVVDRSPFDRIIAAGGYISVRTGAAPEAHSILVRKEDADKAFDAAQCIGCGACVAACPNAAAMLFVGAKVNHLALLPQGGPERNRRVLKMVAQMDREGFGNCSNHNECEAACPKGVNIKNIARMNREHLVAAVK